MLRSTEQLRQDFLEAANKLGLRVMASSSPIILYAYAQGNELVEGDTNYITFRFDAVTVPNVYIEWAIHEDGNRRIILPLDKFQKLTKEQVDEIYAYVVAAKKRHVEWQAELRAYSDACRRAILGMLEK
jgi:hypothetical protein